MCVHRQDEQNSSKRSWLHVMVTPEHANSHCPMDCLLSHVECTPWHLYMPGRYRALQPSNVPIEGGDSFVNSHLKGRTYKIHISYSIALFRMMILSRKKRNASIRIRKPKTQKKRKYTRQVPARSEDQASTTSTSTEEDLRSQVSIPPQS